jgi:uncharacterized repeat protein (TIGR03803 family)
MGSKHFWCFVSRSLAVVAVTVILVNGVWAANKEKVLYSFTGGNDGGRPAADLVFDKAGNLYGTTVIGGNSTNCTGGCGAVFKLTRDSDGKWNETVLYNFQAGADGKNPYGGVTIDSEGNLVGTTVAGGAGGICTGDGCGVVYMLTHSGNNWNQSVLYSFTGGEDGANPGGGLVIDKKGYIYGTAPTGGKPNGCGGLGCGVIYQLVTVEGGGWQENVIHTFSGGKDGATGSLGRLHFDKAGNLYGVAETGGDVTCNPPSGCGSAFRLSPLSGGQWKISTLHAFKDQPDGGFPYGGLISDATGSLYGTTYFGGKTGAGTVFKLTAGSNGKWTETVLYSFQGAADGGNPTSTLALSTTGSLYGTTTVGGDSNGDGVVFKLTHSSGGWKESVVHQFQGADGANPNYGMAQDKAGKLYGVTPFGGSGHGVVFQITP